MDPISGHQALTIVELALLRVRDKIKNELHNGQAIASALDAVASEIHSLLTERNRTVSPGATETVSSGFPPFLGKS